MKDNENLEQSAVPRFSSQWRPNKARLRGQYFELPTCTVPDQSMTIQEIIAKFTRTGLVPQSYAKRDQGGNAAFGPDFDPLDDYSETMAEAAAGLRDPANSSQKDIPSSEGAGPGDSGVVPESPGAGQA